MKASGSYELRYPEHAKRRACLEESRTISRFLDWLEESGYFLGKEDPNATRAGEELMDTGDLDEERRESLLARFFEIDLDKIESERRDMVDSLEERGNANL